jgi:hypothetical protein
MRVIKEARVDHASTSGVLRLVRDAEGFSIREGLLYKPMGHKKLRVLTLYAGRDKRLTDKAEALRRFAMEVEAMGASYV